MPLVTRKELAEKLGISPRSLAHFLPILELAGLPYERRPGRKHCHVYDEELVIAAIEALEAARHVLRHSPQWKAKNPPPIWNPHP